MADSSSISEFGVDSFLELYTTVFAWHQYNVMWDILTETGLAFLPFFALIIRAFIDVRRVQTGTNASFVTLKRVEIEFIKIMVVIILAAQPVIPLKVSELSFKPLCRSTQEQNTTLLTVQNDPSEFGKTEFIGDIDTANIPVFWFGVMAISSGVTRAAIEGLPCIDDMRTLRYRMDTAAITDPTLQLEIQDFISDCYAPTHSYVTQDMFLDSTVPEQQSLKLFERSQYRNELKRQGQSEVSWIGSRVYRNIDSIHFYSKRSASSVIAPFTKNKGPFDEQSNPFINPTCLDWWEGFTRGAQIDDVGIMDRLAKSLVSQKIPLPDTQEGIEGRIKTLIKISLEPTTDQKIFPSLNDQLNQGAFVNVDELSGTFLMLIKTLIDFPLLVAIQDGFPIAIALILMAIYLMLPVGLLISGFSVQFLVTAAAAIFAVKFTMYLLIMIYWIDQNMILAIGRPIEDLTQKHGDAVTVTSLLVYIPGVSEVKRTTVGLDILSGGLSARVYDAVVIAMYMFIPSLFLMIAGWGGLNLGMSLGQVFDRMGGKSSSAAKGAAMAGKLTRSAVTKGVL